MSAEAQHKSSLRNILNMDTMPMLVGSSASAMSYAATPVSEDMNSMLPMHALTRLKRTASPAFEESAHQKRVKETLNENGNEDDGDDYSDEERGKHPHDHIQGHMELDPADPSISQSGDCIAIEKDDHANAADGGSQGTDGSGQASENGGIDKRIDGQALVDHLAEELQCGCCAELVYRPVLVSPCQHFFCGSCCTLWIKNGGTNCPACRGVSIAVTPSRALQSMVDVLLRAAPYMIRAERERAQADEIYNGGRSLRIPTPREPSPEPPMPPSSDFARPCPHCLPGNAYGWRCPAPIPDPMTDADNAWHLDDGTPPGHGYCGNCEVLLALHAPTSTKCDLCQVSFCGINVQGRCSALPLATQHPHGMADIGDLIQSADVYEAFDSNTVEVEIMLDYMTAQRLTPRHVYREIVAHIQTLPRGFAPLIEQDLFLDVHGVAGGIDPDPSAPRSRICRLCATEVLLWGLRDWWVRERRKGFLEENVAARKDCADGSECRMQTDLAHAKEFNHIVVPSESPIAPQPPSSRTIPSLPTLAELGFHMPSLSTFLPDPRSMIETSATTSSMATEAEQVEQTESQIAVEEQLSVESAPVLQTADIDFLMPMRGPGEHEWGLEDILKQSRLSEAQPSSARREGGDTNGQYVGQSLVGVYDSGDEDNEARDVAKMRLDNDEDDVEMGSVEAGISAVGMHDATTPSSSADSYKHIDRPAPRPWDLDPKDNRTLTSEGSLLFPKSSSSRDHDHSADAFDTRLDVFTHF